jgi:hypothetical protein
MNYFDEEHIYKLKSLSPSYLEYSKLERLKYIYTYSKNKFEENLKRYKETKIKFILFGEAPPWTETGIPQYFYSSIKGNLHKTFWRTFFTSQVPSDMSFAYQELANRQFLLLDSIPYALKYSSKIRRTITYQNLIFEYLTTEITLLNKFLEFDSNLKIAFAFRINAEAIINAFSGEIAIGKDIVQLKDSYISADGTGFPKSDKLKLIFGVN